MIPVPPAASCLSASVVSVAQIAARSVLAFVNTDQNSGASVEGVTAAVAGGWGWGGNPPAEGFKSHTRAAKPR